MKREATSYSRCAIKWKKKRRILQIMNATSQKNDFGHRELTPICLVVAFIEGKASTIELKNVSRQKLRASAE